ncbi:MAG: hypothetical protein IKA80_07245, partial [Spirochaetaceae bacterium]|nr:hypothetical protein [Spirochaetaceae bacterium]
VHEERILVLAVFVDGFFVLHPCSFFDWVSYILLCESDKKMRFCGEKFGFLKFLVDIATRIRFCYAKSVGERQVYSCPTQETVGFPKTCGNFSSKTPSNYPKSEER